MIKRLVTIRQDVLDGDLAQVEAEVTAALEAGLGAETILKQGLIEAMAEVGRRFEAGEYFVPQMLIAARAMKGGLAILKPHLVDANVQPAGKVVAGTVKGDLHDIGKNLVCIMLEGAGFEIEDLGADVAPEAFVAAVQSGGVDIVAMSALLTTTMSNMERTLKALEAAGVRERVKVIVGGAPVTEAYAQQIGADGYAPDASRTVTLAQKLIR